MLSYWICQSMMSSSSLKISNRFSLFYLFLSPFSLFQQFPSRLDSALWWCLVWQSCIPTPWIFTCAGFSAVFRYTQYQGIRYWGSRQFLLSKRAACVLSSEFLRGLLVVRSSGGSVGLYLSLVTCLYQVISGFIGRTSLRLQVVSQEVFSLPSVIFVSWQGRSLGMASSLSDRITHMAVFPCFLWINRE